jgi:hypothetical protein
MRDSSQTLTLMPQVGHYMGRARRESTLTIPGLITRDDLSGTGKHGLKTTGASGVPQYPDSIALRYRKSARVALFTPINQLLPIGPEPPLWGNTRARDQVVLHKTSVFRPRAADLLFQKAISSRTAQKGLSRRPGTPDWRWRTLPADLKQLAVRGKQMTEDKVDDPR